MERVLLIVSLSNRHSPLMAGASQDRDLYYEMLYNKPDLMEAVHLLARQVPRRLIFTSHLRIASIAPLSRRPWCELPSLGPSPLQGSHRLAPISELPMISENVYRSPPRQFWVVSWSQALDSGHCSSRDLRKCHIRVAPEQGSCPIEGSAVLFVAICQGDPAVVPRLAAK